MFSDSGGTMESNSYVVVRVEKSSPTVSDSARSWYGMALVPEYKQDHRLFAILRIPMFNYKKFGD